MGRINVHVSICQWNSVGKWCPVGGKWTISITAPLSAVVELKICMPWWTCCLFIKSIYPRGLVLNAGVTQSPESGIVILSYSTGYTTFLGRGTCMGIMYNSNSFVQDCKISSLLSTAKLQSCTNHIDHITSEFMSAGNISIQYNEQTQYRIISYW